MNIKERILSVYHNVKPDRVPVTIYDSYLIRGAAERELREMGLGIVKNHHVVSMLAPPWHFTSGYISEVKNVSPSVHYFWESGNRIERRVFETPVGTVWQESEKDPGGSGSAEHIRKHYITKLEDYKVIQYIIENTVIQSYAKNIAALYDDIGNDGVVLGRIDRSPYQKCLIELAGPEQFLIDLYVTPEPVLSLLEAQKKKMLSSIELLALSKPDVFWAPENITCDMTPPNAYKTYCMPIYEEYSKYIKTTKTPYMIHIDGKMKPLTDLINDSSFDIIESLSYPDIGGDYSLAEAHKAFPEKVVIPNFPTNVCYLDDEDVKKYTKNLVEQAAEKPFLISFSEDIPLNHWKRLIRLVCEAVS